MTSNSSLVKTFPIGFCGVFTMSILVRGVIARLNMIRLGLCGSVVCSPKFVEINLPIVTRRGFFDVLRWVKGDIDTFPPIEDHRR